MASIYKICEQSLWRAAGAEDMFLGLEVDKRDGFIHCSTAAQLTETAARHYAKKSDLVLVAVDADVLGLSLIWEWSRRSELFPHLYGVPPFSAVR